MPSWFVVGGVDRGGIVVRDSFDLKSPQKETRLTTGSILQELELVGDRLHYWLRRGEGPQAGWVSVCSGGRDLLVPWGAGEGAEKHYQVVHERVAVRSAPTREGEVKAVLRKGDRIYGMAFEVDSVPWLRLSSRMMRKRLQLPKTLIREDEYGWVMITGAHVGDRPVSLLQAVPMRGGDTASTQEGAAGHVGARFQVSGLSGALCTVTTERHCTLHDLKVAIEGATCIPAREQRLVFGVEEISDASAPRRLLDSVSAGEDPSGGINVTLIRRPPEQSHWLERIQKRAGSLGDAPPEVQRDREVVLAALTQKPDALKWAAPELRNDSDFITAAAARHCDALMHAAQELREDARVVLHAVKHHGTALRHAAPDLRAHEEVVLAAVQQDWRALRWASQGCRASREVVLAAVRQDGRALLDASEELLADPEVVLAATRTCGHLVTCPRGHALRSSAILGDCAECDECDATVLGGSCLNCHRCDFDICAPCAQRRGRELVRTAGQKS